MHTLMDPHCQETETSVLLGAVLIEGPAPLSATIRHHLSISVTMVTGLLNSLGATCISDPLNMR